MILEVSVQPTTLEMKSCERKNLDSELQSTLVGKRPNGENVFGPVRLIPQWESEDTAVAEVGADGTIRAKQQGGETTVRAKLSQDPELPNAEITLVVTPNARLELTTTEGIVKVDASLPIGVSAVESEGGPLAVSAESFEWSSSDSSVADVLPTTGEITLVKGVEPGHATITATYTPPIPDDKICDELTATASIMVVQDLVGTWELTPRSISECCRYEDAPWWDAEPDDSSFLVELSQPRPEDSRYIEATYVPDAGLTLTGSWDEYTGAFMLSANTSNAAECDYMFYESDICGDATDCRFVACHNETVVSGSIAVDNLTLDAESAWAYSVTYSYRPFDTIRYMTWECQGSSTLDGTHR
jgi:hypothetical protein